MSEPIPERDDRERRIANALADFLDREALGEAVEIDSFCRLHADLQPEIENQLRSLADIAGTASSSRPDILSGYKILDEIGSGGMGRVFLALDEGLGRRVAIKTLASRYSNDSHLRARFMQEARSMAQLSHPNVVRIYNLGQPGEIPHFVMEYVVGVPLTQACQPLTLRQKIEMLYKIALAVDFLHRNDVIHRDLKPGNILVGADLEPKLLDFGLALHLGNRDRLTRSGIAVGTPRYFSPEQALGNSDLDSRSDIFSLGTILYELLTGVVPFRGRTLDEEIEIICERDPVLPRRMDARIPGELQNICLKALEKMPADRYGSARDLAEDLARYLAGEQPLALPATYSRLTPGKIDRHIKELEAWKKDEILSEDELQALKKDYSRLIERDDAWIMETRRLTVSQVSLYLGAWMSVVGAALLVLFDYADLTGFLKIAIGGVAIAPMGLLGIRCWKQGALRTGMAFLLAFCFLFPIVLLVVMEVNGIQGRVPKDQEDLEFFSNVFEGYSFNRITNAQLWWSLLLSLPAYLWLRRFTGSSVFSLVFAVAMVLLSLVWLFETGLLRWIGNEEYGDIFPHVIPLALLFFAFGMIIERFRYPADSRYFYPIGVGFTWISLTGLAAANSSYMEDIQYWWSGVREQRAYLFLMNAAIYFVLQALCDRLPWPQMRSAARAFRFVIPGHVLLSLLSLGENAMNLWLGVGQAPDAAYKFEARTFEILLPCVACAFVYLSIPRQMKNFFVWGMVFLAIGVVNLQNDIFADRRGWLICLMLGGLLVMLAAAHYANLRMAFARSIRFGRK